MEETITTQETMAGVAAPATAATTPVGPTADEQQVASEIRDLWAAHQDGHATVKRTKAEIKTVREHLSERLCRMKQVLAKPGRNGGWSAFLRSEGIAKAAADRLARRHLESGGEQSVVVTGEVPQPAPANVERLMGSLLPRLRNSLATAESAYEFVVRFVGAFGLDCDTQNDCILVLNPLSKESPKTADPFPASGAAQTASADEYGSGDAL